MKARGILFSAPMIRALLAGTKTQTRRIVKPQPELAPHHEPVRAESRGDRHWVFMTHTDRPGYAFATGDVMCPYGVVGDLLWCRETWAKTETTEEIIDADTGPSGCFQPLYRWTHYRATPHKGFRVLPDRVPVTHLHESQPASASTIKRWTPGIHMPRWASRLTLRISDIRVERVQSISEADAIAEGLTVWADPPRVTVPHYGIDHADVWENDPRLTYQRLWKSINGAESWAANPWTWAVTFEALHQNVDDVIKAAA